MYACSYLNYLLPFEFFDASLDFESAYALSSCAHTASVTSFVPALPPRSRVRMPRSVTASTLSISFFAAPSSPSQISISDAVQRVATGLATPLPVMSKAEPWIGSNMDGYVRVGSRLLVGAIPIEPASAAARSDKMSACCDR
jgi:hypothetical protein